MPNAELRPIESILGHFAGSGVDPIGKLAIDGAINERARLVRPRDPEEDRPRGLAADGHEAVQLLGPVLDPGDVRL